MPFLDLQKVVPQTMAKRPVTFRGRVPTKPDINFAAVGVKRLQWWVIALSVLVAVLLVAAFVKFLVFDKLAAVTAAQAEASDVQNQLQECYRRIDSYGELNDVYAHYTYSGMTEEELGRVDRVAVMDLLRRVVFPRTQIGAWTLKGNRLSLSIEGSTLQEINETVQQLLEEDLVSYCEVNTAATENYYDDRDTIAERVTANIVVYLTQPEEVEAK